MSGPVVVKHRAIRRKVCNVLFIPAFENCKRLKRVVSRIPADSLFVVDNSVFNNIDEGCILYVPKGAKEAYENAFGWNNFDAVKEF